VAVPAPEPGRFPWTQPSRYLRLLVTTQRTFSTLRTMRGSRKFGSTSKAVRRGRLRGYSVHLLAGNRLCTFIL